MLQTLFLWHWGSVTEGLPSTKSIRINSISGVNRCSCSGYRVGNSWTLGTSTWEQSSGNVFWPDTLLYVGSGSSLSCRYSLCCVQRSVSSHSNDRQLRCGFHSLTTEPTTDHNQRPSANNLSAVLRLQSFLQLGLTMKFPLSSNLI